MVRLLFSRFGENRANAHKTLTSCGDEKLNNLMRSNVNSAKYNYFTQSVCEKGEYRKNRYRGVNFVNWKCNLCATIRAYLINSFSLYIFSIVLLNSLLRWHWPRGAHHGVPTTIIQLRTLQPTGATQKDHITRQHTILLRTISKCNRSTACRWMGRAVLVLFALAAADGVTARAGERNFYIGKCVIKFEWERGCWRRDDCASVLASNTSSPFLHQIYCIVARYIAMYRPRHLTMRYERWIDGGIMV